MNQFSPTEWKISRSGFKPETLDILTNTLTTELSRRHTAWHNLPTSCYHRICHFGSFDAQLSTYVTPWNHWEQLLYICMRNFKWNMISVVIWGQRSIMFLQQSEKCVGQDSNLRPWIYSPMLKSLSYLNDIQPYITHQHVVTTGSTISAPLMHN